MAKQCEHSEHEKQNISQKTKGCEECEQEYLPWVAIRMCLTCGHVGCCDSSVGKHATKHFEETGHPVMIAVPDKSWKWCYVHKEYY
jgi:uncharacterized UBP type Zn finger protein